MTRLIPLFINSGPIPALSSGGEESRNIAPILYKIEKNKRNIKIPYPNKIVVFVF